jgi:hypothetical protein
MAVLNKVEADAVALGVMDMNRLFFLVGAMLLCAGCASETDRVMWESAMKDLRGDNMQMKDGVLDPDRTSDSFMDSKYRH